MFLKLGPKKRKTDEYCNDWFRYRLKISGNEIPVQ